MLATSPEKITLQHRARRAYVYVRQSSPQQVKQHQESRLNQYALVERAQALGWPRERIQIIDTDLGQSGQDGQRAGFQELVAAVSLRQVGIILAYEASRLARNNTDWYTLLDLATVVGTLIADGEGVYDPRDYNDRLLLGLRGILSEAELHLLHLRMDAGRLRQVERGTYRQRLPTGLVRLPDGRVVKDPDLQVQRTIDLAFSRFTLLGSCQKVMRSLRDDGVLFPRRQHSSAAAEEMLWRLPSTEALMRLFHNPAYAGAFVYGRNGPHPERRPGQARRVRRPPEAWIAIHQAVYPAYISWDTYMENQERLADNASAFARRAHAAPREGAAMLAGLVVCGRCGQQMHVVYKPKQRYSCVALASTYGAATCQHVDGPLLDAAVVDAFFAALAPAELDLLEETLAAQRADHDRLAQQYADQVTRAEYEAQLAQRQYNGVDPDNRLVAGELERRWELALRAVVEAQEAAARFAQQPPAPGLDPQLAAQLRDIGRHLPDLWAGGRLSPAHKKELLRSLMRRVIVHRTHPATVDVRIVWVSGAVSALTVQPPVGRTADVRGYEDMVARTLTLSAAGCPDAEIARRLTDEGFRAARGPTITASLVSTVRRAQGHVSVRAQCKAQPKVDGQWTVSGLAQALGVPRNWVYARIRNETLPARRDPLTGYFLITDSPNLLANLATQHERSDAH